MVRHSYTILRPNFFKCLYHYVGVIVFFVLVIQFFFLSVPEGYILIYEVNYISGIVLKDWLLQIDNRVIEF